MKLKTDYFYHDLTKGSVYNVMIHDEDCGDVIVVDDVGDRQILLDYEYEVVEE